MDEEPKVEQAGPAPRVVLPRRRRRSSMPSWAPVALLGSVGLLGFATGGLVVAPQIASPPVAARAVAPTLALSTADSAAVLTEALRSSEKGKKGKGTAKTKGRSAEKAKGKESEKGKGKKGKEKGGELVYVELDNMIVNPAGSEGAHFLMVTVSLGVKDSKLVTRIEDNKIALQDAIASTLSDCSMGWLAGPGARDSLKIILADRVAEVTGISDEVAVFLPQFVMQ